MSQGGVLVRSVHAPPGERRQGSSGWIRRGALSSATHPPPQARHLDVFFFESRFFNNEDEHIVASFRAARGGGRRPAGRPARGPRRASSSLPPRRPAGGHAGPPVPMIVAPAPAPPPRQPDRTPAPSSGSLAAARRGRAGGRCHRRACGRRAAPPRDPPPTSPRSSPRSGSAPSQRSMCQGFRFRDARRRNTTLRSKSVFACAIRLVFAKAVLREGRSFFAKNAFERDRRRHRATCARNCWRPDGEDAAPPGKPRRTTGAPSPAPFFVARVSVPCSMAVAGRNGRRDATRRRRTPRRGGAADRARRAALRARSVASFSSARLEAGAAPPGGTSRLGRRDAAATMDSWGSGHVTKRTCSRSSHASDGEAALLRATRGSAADDRGAPSAARTRARRRVARPPCAGTPARRPTPAPVPPCPRAPVPGRGEGGGARPVAADVPRRTSSRSDSESAARRTAAWGNILSLIN